MDRTVIMQNASVLCLSFLAAHSRLILPCSIYKRLSFLIFCLGNISDVNQFLRANRTNSNLDHNLFTSP